MNTGKPASTNGRARFEMLLALIRRDDHGIHVSDDIRWVAHAMRDAGRSSDCLGIFSPITPDMGDFCPCQTQRGTGLSTQIIGNHAIAGIANDGGVESAIDDGTPTEGMAVLFDHADHGQAQMVVELRQY